MPLSHRLIPFGTPDLKLDFSARLTEVQEGRFLLTFCLEGDDLRDLQFSLKPQTVDRRKDLLWEHTCFEFFYRTPGSKSYHEYNLAPTGAWNHYSFSQYRKRSSERDQLLGMEPEQTEAFLGHNRLECEFEVQLAVSGPFEYSFSAVLESLYGSKSYWALNHLRPEPDFHAPESMIGKYENGAEVRA